MPTLVSAFSLPPIVIPHKVHSPRIYEIPTRKNFSYFRTSRSRSVSVVVAKLGFHQFPDSSDDLDAFVRFTQDASSSFERLMGKAEGAIYALSDAAVETVNTVNEKQQSGDWLSGITYLLESVLKVLKDGLSALHVPYSYGFAIILLTVLVKAATFPLTKKQTFMPRHEYENLREEEKAWGRIQRLLVSLVALLWLVVILSTSLSLNVVFPADSSNRPLCHDRRIQPLPIVLENKMQGVELLPTRII